MTYAPAVLLECKDYAVDGLGADPRGVGIVGDLNHISGYHVGWDKLVRNRGWADYSATHDRDRQALRGPTRDAACALDLTCRSKDHRAWLTALLADFRRGVEYTLDLRAINGTLDGKTAWRWDREAGFKPVRTDDSHLSHSHLEWYRDAIAAGRPQLAIVKRFHVPVKTLRRKAAGTSPISINVLAGGRRTWAQLVPMFYLPPYPLGADLYAAGEALRDANRGRPAKQDGSGAWETVSGGSTITVPPTITY